MRISKYISDTGFCSRREADRLLSERRVTVNGVAASVGTLYQEGDDVLVDGQPLRARVAKGGRKHVYIALYKPVGITCTTDTSIGGNIVDFVGHEQRIFPVGRLDKDSEGLILMTSNGNIVNEILRHENGHEKEYLVEVNKEVTQEFLTGMANDKALPYFTFSALWLPYYIDTGLEPSDSPDVRRVWLSGEAATTHPH